MAHAVASKVELPTSAGGWTRGHDLVRIDRKTAAALLAFVATESLAYGRWGPPRESYAKQAAAALGVFDTNSTFLTNTADWISGSPIAWSAKLTTATFEAGLIAYDDRYAMIYWVEEED